MERSAAQINDQHIYQGISSQTNNEKITHSYA